MGDEQYTVWLNSHKAKVLEPLLAATGTNIEQEAQRLLENLYQQTVPEQQRQEVAGLIEQDRLQSQEDDRRRAEEARRNQRVGVFSATENGVTQHFVCDLYNRPAILASKCWIAMKDIDAQRANTLTACAFGTRKPIGPEAFENFLANPGAGPQVVAAAAIDFDSGIFALRQDGQWVAYNLQMAGRTGAAVLRLTAHSEQFQDAEFLSRLNSHVLETETLALGHDGLLDANRLEHLLDAQLVYEVNALLDSEASEQDTGSDQGLRMQ